jgi:hypothetical protein|tara:strand:+ start:799 stop:1077 length:279 start_codon:yes stop_codon:yes gene_type:complete
MNKIVKFWQLSYTSNPTAFWVEMVSAISVIIGSAILTFTVLDPRPDIFVPFYFVGSATGLWGAVLRQAAWVVVLTTWFTAMNCIALYQLFIL